MTSGIFCLEGDWSHDLARVSSVEPMLDLLRRWQPFYVPYIHRNVSTPGGLAGYLNRWLTRRYSRYPILYVACHGTPGVICLDNACRVGFQVSLDFIEEQLAGRATGRLIYFGSCGTLRTHSARLEQFLATTGAVAVCGYGKDVDWLTSTAFELLVLGSMQQEEMTMRGMRRAMVRVREQAGGLGRQLGFRMVLRRGRAPVVPLLKGARRR